MNPARLRLFTKNLTSMAAGRFASYRTCTRPWRRISRRPLRNNKPPSDSQQALSAFGAHEVIIESAKHIDRMSALSVEELRNVLEAYSARLRHWRETARFRYCLLFKNQGPCAGASIAHLHSQIIALPFVPAAVQAENARASAAYSQPRVCPYCCLLAKEQASGNRGGFRPRRLHRILPLCQLAAATKFG